MISFSMDFLWQNEKTNREEKKKTEDESIVRLMKEKDQSNVEISALKQELEMTKNTYKMRCLDLENEAKSSSSELEQRLKELEHLLEDSKNKVRELESYSENKCQSWSQKESSYKSFMEFQFGALQVNFQQSLYYFIFSLLNCFLILTLCLLSL